MRTICKTLAWAACCILALAAAAIAQADPVALRVGTPAGSNFTFLPVRIGVAEGIFQRHGLDVVVSDFGGGAKLQQAMVAGALDMAVSAGTDIGFIIKGAPELAVAAMGSKPTLGIVVPYDSPARTVDDLKGKKVGVTTAGSLTEWLMHRLMRRKGWGPNDVTLVHIGSGLQNEIALITTDQIDGVVAPSALGFQLERQKRGRLLLSSFDLGGDFLGEAIFASDRILHDDPGAVRKFLAGWFETIAWIRGHKPETVAFVRQYTHFAPEVESREYDLTTPIFSTDGKFHPAALKALSESFVEMGTTGHPVDLAKYVTEAYLPKK